jgi:signal transduction histidine kinase/ligand-binding sensor domain-containing protein
MLLVCSPYDSFTHVRFCARLWRSSALAMRIVVLYFFIVLLPTHAAIAEELADYSHVSWTAKDGLPAGPILALALDGDGFLWIGGQTGLVRFDGLRFVAWDELGQPALPPRPVSALAAGADGSLWIGFGNEGGVGRISGRTLTFFTAEDGIPGGAVRAILHDTDSVWVAGGGGLSRYQNDVWQPIGVESGLPSLSGESLFVDSERRLWFGSSVGVFRRDHSDSSFIKVTSPPYTVRSLAEDRAGTVLFTHPSSALQTFDGSRVTNVAAPDAVTPTNGSRLLRDRKGNLWIGTIGQGLVFNPASGAAPERYTESQGLSGSWIQALVEDTQGNVWVGTIGGLDLIRESRIKQIGRTELNGELVRTLTSDSDGNVWLGTSDGLYRTSGYSWRVWRRSDGLPPGGVTALHDDGRGTLWIGSDKHLAYLTKEGLRAVSLPLDPSIERITAITHDSTGALWLCDYIRGLFHWDGTQLRLFDRIPGVGTQGCAAAYTDTQGRVWIGFIDGTLLMNRNGDFHSYSTRDGLGGGVIRALHEDDEGALWIGSHNGLTRFSNNRFVTLTPREGLPGNGITGIVQGRSGRLWIGLLTGVLHLERSEFDRFARDPSYRVRHRLYDSSDGLNGVLLSTGYPSVALAGDGRVLFLTNAGPIAISATEFGVPPRPPLVRIEGGMVDGRPLALTPTATLASHVDSLTIDYVALNLATPTSTQFRYMLEGFDSAWIDAGSRRAAVYSNLPPRSYRFRVTARAADGVWNDQEATWAFTIAPPFYYSRAFLFTCAFLAVLVVWGGWRLNAARLQRRFAIVTAERTRIAGEIHDTLLQSLLGVSLQFEAISSSLSGSTSTVTIDTIRRRLELTIRETRNSILNLRNETLERRTLPDALREAAEGVLLGTPVTFDLSVSGRPRRCQPWLEEQLLRVGHEAICNVARHAHATRVSLAVHYGDNEMSLRVEDDGCGFSPAALSHTTGSHCGIQTIRERIARAGGRFILDSAPGRGTSLEVVVPI